MSVWKSYHRYLPYHIYTPRERSHRYTSRQPAQSTSDTHVCQFVAADILWMNVPTRPDHVNSQELPKWGLAHRNRPYLTFDLLLSKPITLSQTDHEACPSANLSTAHYIDLHQNMRQSHYSQAATQPFTIFVFTAMYISHFLSNDWPPYGMRNIEFDIGHHGVMRFESYRMIPAE